MMDQTYPPTVPAPLNEPAVSDPYPWDPAEIAKRLAARTRRKHKCMACGHENDEAAFDCGKCFARL
jgi:hypothetical protein